MATANPFRFSTKYQDDETDLVYYGYRYYNAGTGRWYSGDPAKELGFSIGVRNQSSTVRTKSASTRGTDGDPNLLAFVRNCPILLIDPDGRDIMTPPGLPDPGVSFRLCNEDEWVSCNKECKEKYGWNATVGRCLMIKLKCRWLIFEPGVWIRAYTCDRNLPDL